MNGAFVHLRWTNAPFILNGGLPLHCRAPLPQQVLLGGILAGWGVFNLVEGVVDHQVLVIDHVRPGPGQLAHDLAFLASGLLLVVIGTLFARRARG